MDVLNYCLENGYCKIKYKGIIEIYPRKFINSIVLESLLNFLQDKNYNIIKITNNWIRAFER